MLARFAAAALALLCLWRLWRADSVVFLYWLAAFSLYALHICGAGDVKVIMIELALWPTPAFVVTLGVTVAVLVGQPGRLTVNVKESGPQ